MHELILHHYPTSPAEKARLMLGFKQLSWRSVMIPPVMPAGSHRADRGYRRTPVLQVGADIYCDTALIARRLEAEKATRRCPRRSGIHCGDARSMGRLGTVSECRQPGLPA